MTINIFNMLSLLRIAKTAFQDMGRNLGLTFMTMFILVLMLLSINMLWAVDGITREAIDIVKGQVNVSVYLAANANDKNVDEMKKYIQSFPEVTELNVSSREEVLATFKNRHRLSTEVLSALDELGGNPFGPTLVIKTREPGDYKKIIEALSVPEYDSLIEGKSFDEHQDAIDRIQNITSRIEKVGLVLSLVFALISFLIIFNTVRVAIHTQRVEISIKRLVGASNWFIRGPYIVQSIFFTVVSVAISFAFVFLALRWVDPYLSVIFPSGFSLTEYYTLNLISLTLMQFVVVLVLTIISSSLAMRRQLKV